MDIGTAATVSSGIFGLVSIVAIVIAKFAPKAKNGNGVRFCPEHPQMKEDVRIARVILLRLAKHSGIDVSEFEDLVR